MLFGDNEQKKKQKEQRSREKEWKGKLTGAGMEKGAAGELAKIITEAQRSGESLQKDYKTSREHLERAPVSYTHLMVRCFYPKKGERN